MAHERRATVAVTAYKSDYRRPQSRSLSIIIEQVAMQSCVLKSPTLRRY